MNEATVAASVPAAHIEVAFRKVGVDPKKFMQDEPEVMLVKQRISNESFHRVISKLIGLQEETERTEVHDLVAAMVVNLTTENSLSNEELDLLYSMASQHGNMKEQSPSTYPATPGMAKALARLSNGGRQCPHCNFTLPKYPGRYPTKCPSCGKTLNVGPSPAPEYEELDIQASVDGMVDMLSEFYRMVYIRGVNETVVLEHVMVDRVRTIFKRLSAGSKQALARAIRRGHFKDKEVEASPVLMVEGSKDEFLKSLKEASDIEITLFSPAIFALDDEQNWDLSDFAETRAVPRADVFNALVENVCKHRGDFVRDQVVSDLFRLVFEGEDYNIVESLRAEVSKRGALKESIEALKKDKNRFRLVKALSSCLTRTMIEGESKGSESYELIGEAVFRMMRRAFDGEFEGPSRFVSVFFLG